ncbi:MAG: hypothetical protein OSJ46_04710 [Duncaniella sp.]|nr:hypothetical protein [Duncaniella sp.]
MALSRFNSRPYEDRQFLMIADDTTGIDTHSLTVFRKRYLPEDVRFPKGHPQSGVLYVAHPTDIGLYFPSDEADGRFICDKMHDFTRLAQGLGATKITVSYKKGRCLSELLKNQTTHSGGASYKAVSGNVSVSNSSSTESRSKGNGRMLLVTEFDPVSPPYIPEHLLWLDEEPEWKHMTEMRMEGNILRYSLTISSSSSATVSESKKRAIQASVKIVLASLNYAYDSEKYRNLTSEEDTEWVVDVEFRSIRELGQSEPTKKSNWFSRLFGR